MIKNALLLFIALCFGLSAVAHDLHDFSKPEVKTEMRQVGDKQRKFMTIDGVLVHERDPEKQAQPPVVTPGTESTEEKAGTAPSDAVALFDGTEATLVNWTDGQGNPTKWRLADGALESVKGAGYLHSKESFGSCQLHIEFATPAEVKGSGQGRGNSGVFIMGYEVQVLDSFENKTYPDGQAGALYGRAKPLVNASRAPGKWQSFDIIFHRPRFDEQGKLTQRATFTVLHNGVLIQNATVLSGNTSWNGPHAAGEYKAHPDKLPLKLQDHGNPVRYRNIWIRELE